MGIKRRQRGEDKRYNRQKVPLDHNERKIQQRGFYIHLLSQADIDIDIKHDDNRGQCKNKRSRSRQNESKDRTIENRINKRGNITADRENEK